MPTDETFTGRLLAPPLAGQLARFAAVGVSNTALSWGLFALALKLGVWYPVASALAFAAGAANGYTLNRIWTFRAGAFRASGLLRYTIVQAIGLVTNVALVVALVEWLALAHLAAQAVAIGIVALLTFALNRRWAFAPPGA